MVRFDIGWSIGYVKRKFVTTNPKQKNYDGMYEVTYPLDNHCWYHGLKPEDYGETKTWVLMKSQS